MKITADEMRVQYYLYIENNWAPDRFPTWRDQIVMKFPQDMILYAQAIFKNKPDWIVETGTYQGGSALFFADLLSITGGQGVITIDSRMRSLTTHERVKQIISNSTDLAMFRRLRHALKGKGSVMVSLDAKHATDHVRQELKLYSQIVTPGQYLVVEDCWTGSNAEPYTPHKAVQDFLAESKGFTMESPEDQFIFAVTRGGWLKKGP